MTVRNRMRLRSSSDGIQTATQNCSTDGPYHETTSSKQVSSRRNGQGRTIWRQDSYVSSPTLTEDDFCYYYCTNAEMNDNTDPWLVEQYGPIASCGVFSPTIKKPPIDRNPQRGKGSVVADSIQGSSDRNQQRINAATSCLPGKEPDAKVLALACIAEMNAVLGMCPGNSTITSNTMETENSLKGRIRSSLIKRPSKSSLKRTSLDETSSSDDSSQDSVKRSVNFSRLHIREYDIALSDHPSCSQGPPIQLGWNYRDSTNIPLDDYENSRFLERRRSVKQLLISYRMRRYLLLKHGGCSPDDLREAMKEVDRVKRERLLTDIMLPASGLHETWEEVIDGVKGFFRLFGANGNSKKNNCVK